MINPSPQSRPDVFAMILQSSGDPAPMVQAARQDLPAGELWQPPEEEGQLAVDVIESGPELVIISTMAGADQERIEVYLHNDLLTIRGERRRPLPASDRLEYIHAECFWGPFSRTIVLPVEVHAHKAKAEYKNGVLTVWIEKRNIDARIPIKIVDE